MNTKIRRMKQLQVIGALDDAPGMTDAPGFWYDYIVNESAIKEFKSAVDIQRKVFGAINVWSTDTTHDRDIQWDRVEKVNTMLLGSAFMHYNSYDEMIADRDEMSHGVAVNLQTLELLTSWISQDKSNQAP